MSNDFQNGSYRLLSCNIDSSILLTSIHVYVYKIRQLDDHFLSNLKLKKKLYSAYVVDVKYFS